MWNIGIKKLMGTVIVVVLLSGCFNAGIEKNLDYREEDAQKILDKYEEKYAKDRETMKKHLEDKYGLNIEYAFVEGNRYGDKVRGYFFDEKDPGMGFQVLKHKDGKIEDSVDSQLRIYKARVKVYELLNQYKQDNELNEYFMFEPVSFKGPIVESSGSEQFQFAVMKDSVNVEKELESDYVLYKEIVKFYKEEFPEKEELEVSGVYIQKDGFDFEKFKKESYTGVMYRQELTNFELVDDLTDENASRLVVYDKGFYAELGGDGNYFEENKMPKEVFKYFIPKEYSENVDSLTFEEYKKIANENVVTW